MVLRPVTRGVVNLDQTYFNILRHNVNDYLNGVDNWPGTEWLYYSSPTLSYANSTAFLSYQYYFSALPYDKCDDGSVDVTKWTSGGDGTIPIEADYYIRILNNHTIDDTARYSFVYSKGTTTSLNLKTEDNSIVFFCYMNCTTTNYTVGWCNIYLTDGTNDVNIDGISASGGTSSNQAGYYEIVTDVSAETVNVWRNGTRIKTNLDISSLVGDTWELKIYSKKETTTDFDKGGVADIYLYVTGKMVGSGTDTDFITINDTTVTGNKFIEHSTWSIGTCTGASYYSINNGTSYIAHNEREVIETSDCTQLRFKFIITPPDTIDVTKENMASMIDIASLYNLT